MTGAFEPIESEHRCTAVHSVECESSAQKHLSFWRIKQTITNYDGPETRQHNEQIEYCATNYSIKAESCILGWQSYFGSAPIQIGKNQSHWDQGTGASVDSTGSICNWNERWGNIPTHSVPAERFVIIFVILSSGYRVQEFVARVSLFTHSRRISVHAKRARPSWVQPSLKNDGLFRCHISSTFGKAHTRTHKLHLPRLFVLFLILSLSMCLSHYLLLRCRVMSSMWASIELRSFSRWKVVSKNRWSLIYFWWTFCQF